MAHLISSIKHPRYSFKTLNLMLNHNASLSVYSLKLPIIWEGTLEGKSLKIVQKAISTIPYNFEFEELPQEFIGAEEDIIAAIDKHLVKWGL